MGIGCDTASSINASKLATLKKEGLTFVGRYLKPNLYGMNKNEAKLISDGGLYVVSIYETYGYKVGYFTAKQGASDAPKSIASAETLGQPENTPIYFAVDFDATKSELLNNIVPYFNAIAEQFKGKDQKIGCYGSKMVCQHLKTLYPELYAMVAGASKGWGGNKNYTFSEWNLYQKSVDKAIGSGNGAISIDYTDSSALGGGGWQV